MISAEHFLSKLPAWTAFWRNPRNRWEGEVPLFLKGTADFLNRFYSRHKIGCLLLLLLGALLLQSCATDITDKSQVPGKLLAIKSLGFRETSNEISVQEIDPYTVRVTRTLCKAELLSIEQQLLIETKQGTQSFDCTDAYATYIAHNITAFGVPLLYDSFTGFNLLKERCRKRPPVYRFVSTESKGVVNNEVYDDNTTACEKLPVADILLTAKIDAAPIYLATSADGTASLPPEKVAQLERARADTLITYKYEAIELTTRHVNKKPATPSKYSIFAEYSPADDYVSKANESPSTENSGEISLGKGFVAALTPATTVPALLPDIVQSGIVPVPAAPRADSGEKVLEKDGREVVGGVSSAAPPASAAVAPETAGEKSTGGAKAAPAAEKIVVAEPPVKAKSAGERAGGMSSPAGILPEVRRDEPAGEKSAGDIKAVPAAAKPAVAVTPAMAPRDQASAAKDSSPKIIREGASAPKASRPLRDGSKVPPGTPSPAMARPQAKTELSAKEVVLQQILIMRPELNGVCCPLTEKFFWNSGK